MKIEDTKEKLIFKDKSIEAVFEEIYKANYWKNEESVSGPGSTIHQTKYLVKELSKLIGTEEFKLILDIPCGDFNWMKNINLDCITYIGGDIVSDIIRKNNSKFSKSNITFMILNLTSDDLPESDLIINRDCLVHFSYSHITESLKNMKHSKSKYLLTTTFTGDRDNYDITTGYWRPINLEKEPFNFPKPIAIINEKCTEEDGEYSDKSLGLWLLDDISI
jgi:hypothetical protein